MFATVTIYAPGDQPSVGVPKEALIYEGDLVRIWVAREDKLMELRYIKTGLTNGDLVEVHGNYQGQPVHRPRCVRQLISFSPL
jgi:cobalt-zinc-cadmium efflux system membrane fusion protein